MAFETINRGYRDTFQPGQLTLGLVVPMEQYADSPVPTMEHHLQRVALAEQLGFAALWLRDVPFNVPSFGDAGQLYDPFVYLGLLAGQTQRIVLGVASIILPLRHPAHVAKAAASVDQLSGGRLLLGVASGDRPEEYPAMGHDFEARGASFRQSFDYIQQVWQKHPTFESEWGSLDGTIDLLPKPEQGRVPLLITGGSQQSPAWVAAHGAGWITYPRPITTQAKVIREWQQRVEAVGSPPKPAMQSLYVDLAEKPDAPPQPIHLGYRLGIDALRDHLEALEEIGIHHVAINLRFNQANIEKTLQRLAEGLFPQFSSGAM